MFSTVTSLLRHTGLGADPEISGARVHEEEVVRRGGTHLDGGEVTNIVGLDVEAERVRAGCDGGFGHTSGVLDGGEVDLGEGLASDVTGEGVRWGTGSRGSGGSGSSITGIVTSVRTGIRTVIVTGVRTSVRTVIVTGVRTGIGTIIGTVSCIELGGLGGPVRCGPLVVTPGELAGGLDGVNTPLEPGVELSVGGLRAASHACKTPVAAVDVLLEEHLGVEVSAAALHALQRHADHRGGRGSGCCILNGGGEQDGGEKAGECK
jgi:hypothetical protein